MEKVQHKDKELRYFCLLSAFLLFVVAFWFDSPKGILEGFITIVCSRDVLITDYFELAGYGAAFFNAGLMLLFAMGLVQITKLPYTGVTLSAIFINVGFALWGKNPINALPIVLGTWCYAKLNKMHFARVVYTALFATCLAPLVSELFYILPFSTGENLIIAILVGLVTGFILPPLAMHTASMHMGYNLFNVGFAAGTVAFVIYSILRSFGIESEPVFIWRVEKCMGLVQGLLAYFVVTFLYGFWLSGGSMSGLQKIVRHPGRAVADFVMMDGAGTTLMNMGLMGILAEVYVLFVEGDISGPALGGIIVVYAFSAFGAHIRNYLPVLIGVYLSTKFSVYEPNSPSILIASMFVVGLSPIAGEFGIFAGILSGMMHSAVVTCTAQLYGGVNLYNNGFAGGFVAIIMVPLMESGMKQFKLRRYERQQKLNLKKAMHLEKNKER